MSPVHKIAYVKMFDIAEEIGKLIVHAKASRQPLALPDGVVRKLTEGQQAVFAAQRLLEELSNEEG